VPNEPWKITVKSGACAIRRTRPRRALDGDLARFKTGAPGWLRFCSSRGCADRCGARPVRRVIGVGSRADAAVARQGLRAAGGAHARDVPRQTGLVTGGSCAASRPALTSRSAYQGVAAQPLRRAPRALEMISEESLHSLGMEQVGPGITRSRLC
jgi:hypothetical protein